MKDLTADPVLSFFVIAKCFAINNVVNMTRAVLENKKKNKFCLENQHYQSTKLNSNLIFNYSAVIF